MKYLPVQFLTLIGGFLGFLTAYPITLASGADATIALRDSVIACLIGAFLLRIAAYTVNASLSSNESQKDSSDQGGNPKDHNPPDIE